MSEDKQGLTADRQPSPPGPDLAAGHAAVWSESAGCGWTDRSTTVDKHAKLLADIGDLGREPVYQELRRSLQLAASNTSLPQSGWEGSMADQLVESHDRCAACCEASKQGRCCVDFSEKGHPRHEGADYERCHQDQDSTLTQQRSVSWGWLPWGSGR